MTRIYVLLCFCLLSFLSVSMEISSWTGQEKRVDLSDPEAHPYQITLERTSSTTPDEPYHCKAEGRRVGYNKSEELVYLL